MATVKPEQFAKQLERALPPFIWVHGNEPLLVIETAQSVRAAARERGHLERELIEVDRHFDVSQLTAAAANQSLFASQRLIELRVPARPLKAFVQALADLCAQPVNPDDCWLISSERPDGALLRSAPYKAVESVATIVSVFPVERERLPGWIGARLRAQGQRADQSLLLLIAERVQGNLLAADQEVRKLRLLFDDGDLPTEAAAAAVLDVARYEAGDLVDALLLGNPSLALRSLSGLAGEGRAEPMVVWHLAECIRTLLKLIEARAAGQALNRAMAAQRVFGPRQRRFEAAMSRISRRELEQALLTLAKADTIAKGLAPGPVWPLLRTLVLRLAGVPIGQTPPL